MILLPILLPLLSILDFPQRILPVGQQAPGRFDPIQPFPDGLFIRCVKRFIAGQASIRIAELHPDPLHLRCKQRFLLPPNAPLFPEGGRLLPQHNGRREPVHMLNRPLRINSPKQPFQLKAKLLLFRLRLCKQPLRLLIGRTALKQVFKLGLPIQDVLVRAALGLQSLHGLTQLGLGQLQTVPFRNQPLLFG
ncbi:Uncharacterised protein [Mycobacterium tuberculosis]|nr:Uncharacterised protein [Mycobacterium tuberculosis]